MNKIAFYIDNMNRGGAQRVMTNLCEHYAANNTEVILINDYPSDGKRPIYELSESIKRIYLQPKYIKNPISNNIRRMINLRRIMKDERPDLVLSFLGGPNIRLLISTIGLMQKTVVSVRNDPSKEYAKSGIKKTATRLLFKLADGCVFQTDEARAYFPESVKSKSAIIFNPIDEKFFGVTRAPHPSEITTAGRMNEQKRHDLLIDAFKLLSETNQEAKLIIYGDGPLKKKIQEKIHILGLDERVYLPGNITNIEEALKTSGLFVLSSDYEGMPNALMEAMAIGIPCISTDCPCGGPRALDGGSQSIKLVKCGDVEDLYHALLEIVENDEIASKMGFEAKKRAELFRPEEVYSEWERYLTAIAGNR